MNQHGPYTAFSFSGLSQGQFLRALVCALSVLDETTCHVSVDIESQFGCQTLRVQWGWGVSLRRMNCVQEFSYDSLLLMRGNILDYIVMRFAAEQKESRVKQAIAAATKSLSIG